jgi:hypothetical protein
MNETTIDLIGRVLQAIASTPHRGHDEGRYQALVVEPARALRRRWTDERDRPLGAEEARQVMEILLGAFDAKRVDADEQRDRIRQILAGSCLEAESPTWLSRVPS